MKYDFRKLTIKTQLIILFVIFVVLASVNFFVLHHYIDQVEFSRKKVELAQNLPGAISKLTDAVSGLTSEDGAEKGVIKKSALKINKIIEIFAEGGQWSKEEPYLEAITGERKKNLHQVSMRWDSVMGAANVLRFDPYKLDTITQDVVEVPNNDSLNTTHTEVVNKKISIDNPSITRAKAFVTDNASELKNRIAILLESLGTAHKQARTVLNAAILIVVFLNFVIFCLLLLGIRKVILQPINQLNAITHEINHGNFAIEGHFEWKNEVSEVAEQINKLAASLENATDFVKEVGNGELNKEFKGINMEDVTQNSLESALLNMRDQMKKVEEEEEIRNWSTGGLAKFVDILRSSNDDVTELCNKIISNLVDYTHSNQGGLYLLNTEDEQDKHLELVSLYAFDTLKYDKKTYRLGEGLVGQTFLERKTTYLLEIPHEYISISSGLGGANPKAILIVPLQVNEEIFGILELASFEEYKDYEIEFIENLGESIASTIASVRNNQRTKRLLQESQELTEQMQAQEEEMRQNMEELSATQEEMARKEIEITAQLTAINNSLGTVEYDINGLITNTNAIFDNAMGYNSGELHEKALASIYQDFQAIWQPLQTGTGQSGEFEFVKKNTEPIRLKSTFTPIKNEEGEVYKIIQLITQFGENKVVAEDQWEEIEAVEATLRQNLEALEITQQQLNEKADQLEILNDIVKIIKSDAEHKITMANNAYSRFSGKATESIKDKSIHDILGAGISEALKAKKPHLVIGVKDENGVPVEKSLHFIYRGSENITIFI